MSEDHFENEIRHNKEAERVEEGKHVSSFYSECAFDNGIHSESHDIYSRKYSTDLVDALCSSERTADFVSALWKSEKSNCKNYCGIDKARDCTRVIGNCEIIKRCTAFVECKIKLISA